LAELARRDEIGAHLLDYLDRLCTALLGRDVPEIRRLLRSPLARALPRTVREEALAIAVAPTTSLRAPIHTLRFYQQTMQLLAEPSDASLLPRVTPRPDEPDASTSREAVPQLELPLPKQTRR
jgi:hypothetical protein